MEEVKDIYTINPEDFLNQKYMIVNTEWGGFGDNGELDFIRTKWDIKVDENSINPGRQTFEKMISGMYMGELIRQVLVDLMKDDLIFFNANREKLFERGNKIYIGLKVNTYYCLFANQNLTIGKNNQPLSVPTMNLVGMVGSNSKQDTPCAVETSADPSLDGSNIKTSVGSVNLRISHHFT